MASAGRTYLDYNASVPLHPAAREALISALATGNASSVHAEGRNARARLEEARSAVAALTGAESDGVLFTSGGSEANTTVLTPHIVIGGEKRPVQELRVGTTDHPSVRDGGQFDQNQTSEIPVDREGVIDLDELERGLQESGERGHKVLVSVMLANNETGVIQPIQQIAQIARRHGALVHTDAAQAAGRIQVDIGELGVDFLTLSAHKIGGPPGAGAIVRRSDNVGFRPLIKGGGQEDRLRAGTENVPAIAGFGEAAKAALDDLKGAEAWRNWRDDLARFLGELGDVTIFSDSVDRLPQTLCFGFAGVSAETLVIGLDLDGIAVSSGSACSSGKVGPSHVLAAMGVPSPTARGAVRVSFGWATSEEDLDTFRNAIGRILKRITAQGDERAA